jgi:hypothetical protein
LKFASGYVVRIGSRRLFPGPLRKFPISSPDRVAILLDEVDTAIVFDRNDNHAIRFLYDTVDALWAAASADRVFADAHAPIFIYTMRVPRVSAPKQSLRFIFFFVLAPGG